MVCLTDYKIFDRIQKYIIDNNMGIVIDPDDPHIFILKNNNIWSTYDIAKLIKTIFFNVTNTGTITYSTILDMIPVAVDEDQVKHFLFGVYMPFIEVEIRDHQLKLDKTVNKERGDTNLIVSITVVQQFIQATKINIWSTIIDDLRVLSVHESLNLITADCNC
jgi:hypothetical protein